MTYVRLKGFQIFEDRHGKWRCYHRASGTAVNLTQFELGTAAFFAECSRITALHQPQIADDKIRTIGALIKGYRAHDDFKTLSPRTRQDYDHCFDYLAPIDATPLQAFTPPLVVKIRDKAAKKMGRKWGNYVKTCMSVAFAWGVERGHMQMNPAFRIKGIKRPKDAPDVNLPWSDEHREAVLKELPAAIAVEIHLMMFCGLDPGDVVKLAANAIVSGRLNTKRQKTKEPVWVELPAPVVAAIERRAALPEKAPKPTTFCWNSRGKSWTKSGLDSAWQKYRAKLIKEGKLPADAVLTLKGLRHTVGTILAEMGKDDRTIADMLAQKTLTMAQHYSKHANRAKKLNATVADFNVEIERRKNKAR